MRHLRNRLLLSAAIVASALPALADDFVISTPQVVTNGGNVVNGNDSITVTGTGSVATALMDALNATGNNNTITNQGLLTTFGVGSDGIDTYAGNYATISNSGSITTNGNYSEGIEARNYNTIDNSGTVTTGGDSSEGIIANRYNTITNSGSITTGGNNSEGIDAFRGNSVVNSGSIATSGDDANGIGSFIYNTIANSGTIATSGNRSEGIEGVNYNTIANSGSITTSGDYSEGVQVTSYNAVANSGSISTSGYRSYGIFASDNNTIANSGSISTTGYLSSGIFASDNNAISSSGSISTTGGRSSGIVALDNNAISNSGSISTTGYLSDGIFAFSSNTITNSGAISTSGHRSDGIFADDYNMIANSGSIATSGDSAEGIVADAYNTITNSGSITTSGDSAEGIQADYYNTVANSGSISTSGDYSIGIYANYYNTIANSGAISTSGRRSVGIYAGYDNTVANTGSISTSGNYAGGIQAYVDNTVSNSGAIATSGLDAQGIYAYEDNTVTNSGSIVTSGSSSIGINAIFGNTVTNTGRIFTSGFGAAGISAYEDNVVFNSGSIVSVNSGSILMAGTNELSLAAPAFLGGAIGLGGAATVNIATGPSHSILWDFSTGTMVGGAPAIGGTVPWFYNPGTQQVATFDPTGLTAGANGLASLSGDISALIGNRFAAGAAGQTNVNAYAATRESNAGRRLAQAFGEASSSYAPPSAGWWLSAFGSLTHFRGDAANLGHEAAVGGLAAGYDKRVSADLALGALVGWSSVGTNANSAFANAVDHEADGVFAAIYGRKQAGMAFLDFAVSGGQLSHSDTRFVNDNLAPLGVSYANGDYSSWWWSPEAGVGVELPGANGWTYIPSTHVRYAMQSVEGYTETGPSAANAVVSGHDNAFVEGRAEIAAQRETNAGLFTGRLGVFSRSGSGDGSVAVSMIGQSASIPVASNDVTAGYAAANLKVGTGSASHLEFDLGATFGGDAQGARGAVKFVANF